MYVFLQCLAGGCYLLQKVFLSVAERAAQNKNGALAARRWRIWAWAIYIVGLPPWLVLFAGWHNWIAACVEASGGPAMVLGLVVAIQDGKQHTPRWLIITAWVCAGFGLACSLYDFGGLHTSNQWLEIGLTLGFLIGTNDLAVGRARGYLWYILMHVACGALMWIQNSPWLVAQQAISLVFIIDAYRTRLNSAASSATSSSTTA